MSARQVRRGPGKKRAPSREAAARLEVVDDGDAQPGHAVGQSHDHDLEAELAEQGLTGPPGERDVARAEREGPSPPVLLELRGGKASGERGRRAGGEPIAAGKTREGPTWRRLRTREEGPQAGASLTLSGGAE